MSDTEIVDLDLPPIAARIEECGTCRGYINADQVTHDKRKIDGVLTDTVTCKCESCGTRYQHLYRKYANVWQFVKARVVTDEQRHVLDRRSTAAA